MDEGRRFGGDVFGSETWLLCPKFIEKVLLVPGKGCRVLRGVSAAIERPAPRAHAPTTSIGDRS